MRNSSIATTCTFIRPDIQQPKAGWRQGSASRRATCRTGTQIAKFLLSLAVVVALLTVGSLAATAATYSWDPNGTGPASVGGTGSWQTGVPNWYSSTAGGDVLWPSNDITDTASFGGPAGVLPALVTLGNAQSANALVFSSTGYTLTGSSLTLGGTSPSISYAGGGNGAVINSTLINSSSTGIALQLAGGTLTFGGVGALSGSGAFNQLGGTLILASTNSNTGYTGAITTTTSGAAPATLKVLASTALGGISGINLVNTAAGGGVLGGTGAAFDLTSITGNLTVAAPVNMTLDPSTSGYNATILGAPALGSALTFSKTMTVSGVATAQFYNFGAGTLAMASAINTGAATAQFIDYGNGVTSLAGSINGTGTISQLGGYLILGGSNTGYTGTFTIATSGSTPAVLKPTTLAGLGNSKGVTLQNLSSLGSLVTGGSGAVLDLTLLTSNGTISTPINMTGDPSLVSSFNTSILSAPASANALTLSGSVNVSGGATIDQFYNSGAGTLNLNGSISGQVGTILVRGGTGTTAINGTISAGSSGLAVTDNATLLINNRGNWGATTINFGTLKLGGANVLPSNTTLTMGQASDSNADTLDLQSASQSIAGLIFSNGTNGVGGTKTITASAGPATLTLGSSGITLNPNVSGTLALAGSAMVVTPAINYPASAAGTSITTAGAATLNLSGGTINASAVPANVNSNSISATVVGIGGLTIQANGNLSDSGGGSPGFFGFTGPNTYAGPTTITSGLVNPGANDNPFGQASNPIILSGGGLLASANATYAATRNIQLASGQVGYLRQYGGASMTINGLISGAGTLDKTDGGSLILTGPNTYSGPTYVGAGTLLVSNTSGSATGTGNVLINNGTLSSGTGNSGVIAGQVLPGSGVMAITPGGVGAYGTLTVGGLTTNANSTISFDLTTPGGSNDSINVTGGTLNLAAGTLAIGNVASYPYTPAPGLYRLFQFNPGTTTLANTSGMTFTGLPRQLAQYALLPDASSGFLDLSMLTVTPTSAGWSVNGGGSWATPGNWAGNVIPAVQGDTALLGSVLTTAGTITLDSQPHVGTLTIAPAGGGNYTILAGANGTLVLENTGATSFINNQVGLNTIAAPITLANPTTSVTVSSGTLLVLGAIGGTGGIAVQGGGPLVLTTNATYTGPTSIAAGGTLQLGNNTASPSLATSGIADSGTLLFNTGAGNGALGTTISGNGSVVFLGNNGGLPVDWTLTSGSNTYAGGTTITGGRFRVTAGGQWGNGPITINPTGEFYLAAAVTASNSFTISGSGATEGAGNLGAIRLQTGTISGNVALASSALITAYGGNGLITGLISGNGSAPLSVGGLGNTLTFTNTGNSYSGGTNLVMLGGNAVTLISGNPGALGGGSVTLPAGPTLGLYADGDGSGAPNVAGIYSNVLNLTGSSGNLAVGRTGLGNPAGNPLWENAANKVVNYSPGLTLASQALNVTNNNGYGLDITGPATITTAGTFSVSTYTSGYPLTGTIITNNPAQPWLTGAQAGLTIDGIVSGVGFVKTGGGVLNLTNAGNNFSGPIAVNQGILGITSDAVLGGNPVILGYNGVTGLRFLNSGTSNADIQFALGTGANTISIETALGQTVTLNSSFDLTVSSSANVVHDDAPGNLILNAGNGSWTGLFQNNGGIVQVNGANYGTALGSVTGQNAVTSNNAGGAFQFLPGQTLAKNFTLSNAGINTSGAIESVTTALAGGPSWSGNGATTLSGSISLANAATIGADPNTVLNLAGGISGAQALTLAVGGSINITTAPLGAVSSLTLYTPGTAAAAGLPAGVTTLSSSSGLFVGPMTLDSGSMFVSGSGQMGGTGAITVDGGASLNVIDSTAAGAAIANRLGSTRPLTLNGGTFRYTANGSSASAEAFGAFSFGAGGSTIVLTNTGAAASKITMASISQGNGGSTLDIDTTGATLGTAQNQLVLTTTATLTPTSGGIIPRVTVNGANFATYSLASSSVVAFAGYNTSNNFDTAGGTATMNLTSAATWTQAFTQPTNAVLIGNGVTLNGPVAGAALAPTTGNLLVPSGSATIGSGTVLALAGVENALLVNSGATLNLQGPVTGTYNITKGLGGTLVVSAPVYDTTTSNWLSVNGGVVKLNAGNQTFLPGILLAVQAGGTLDLNGNGQIFSNLMGANNAGLVGTGGTITSSSGNGTLVTQPAASTTFPGQIVGSLAFAKAGGNTTTLTNINTYTGSTALYGGGLTLQDAGELTGTSGISVNGGATLAINDNGLAGISNRLGNAAINLNSGVITYAGRAQTPSVENLGAVALAQGESFITSSNGGTGVNSADLVLASLTPTHDATIDFSSVAGSSGASGQLGNSGRVQISGLSNTNNIIGPWAITLRDFASYLPGQGVGALNAAGFAGYSNTSLTTSTWQPTDNVKLAIAAATTAAMTANTTINTLNVSYSANPTIDLGGHTLTLGNGTLSGGLMFDTGTSTTVATLQDGFVTAGSTASPADLYLYFLPYAGAARTGNITAAITNNLAGGPVRLVYNATDGATNLLSLNGTNTYTGGTVINAGMLVLGASGTLPAGGITINGGPVNSGGATGLTQTLGGNIASQAVTLNGASALTLAATTQSLTSITINNNGGTTAPTVSGGTISLPAGGISVSSNNVGTTATISSALDFANAAPTLSVAPLSVNGQVVNPWLPSLNISGVIQHAGNLTWTGGGNLQLSGASIFTGGVTVPSGASLIVGANSTPSTPPNGANINAVVSGPLGTGTLTISSGATLLSSGGFTVANPVSVGGNFTTTGQNALTLSGPINMPSGNTVITVPAPQMTTTLSGTIGGSGVSIEKNGFGTLVLNNYNTFTGGVTLDSGILSLTGPNSADPQAAGTGQITLNGGELLLHNNTQLGNGIIYSGNNVALGNTPGAFIDVNNNGANIGGTFLMGALNYTSSSTVLNVTGGNNYGLYFQSTNLSSLTSSHGSINVAAGVTLTLPASGFTAANTPVNVGAGALLFSGAISGNSAAFNVTGSSIQIHPVAGTSGFQLGTSGPITLANNSTLQVVPMVASSAPLSATGYTSGGLLGKYYNFNGTAFALTSTTASGLLPAAVLPGQMPSDASFQIRPVVVANAGSFTDSMAFYSGLLKINTGGTYYFQSGADDSEILSIDGAVVFQQTATGTGGEGITPGAPQAITLAAGLHQITFHGSNLGGNGGDFLMYAGPDTANNHLTQSGGVTPPMQDIPASALYYVNGPANSGNSYQNAAQISNTLSLGAGTSATIDSLGSDLNATFAGLSLGGTSTLSVSNTGGLGTVGIVGLTTISGTKATVSPGSGMLNLIGGVSDGGNGLTKTGSGTLILGPSSPSNFTGPLTISSGYLQIADPAALTSGTTTIATGAQIDLNGIANIAGNLVVSGSGPSSAATTTAAKAALYNTSVTPASLAAGSTLTIGASLTTIGGYGNINLQGTVTDNGLTWNKVGPDMLTLSGANLNGVGGSSLTGTLTVTNGILQAGSATAFGGSTPGLFAAVSSGAVMDLNGQSLSGGTITINGVGLANNTGVNTAGGYGAYNSTLAALINSNTSAAATYSGVITMAAAASIGSGSYLPSSPGGNIVFNGTLNGNNAVTKVGDDNLTFSGLATTTSANFNYYGGTTTFNNTFQQPLSTGVNNVYPSAMLVLDNSSSAGGALNNRLGGHGFINTGGTLDIISAGSSVQESITTAGNNLNAGSNGNGMAVYMLDASGGGSINLNVNSTNATLFTHANQATVLFRGTGLGQTGGLTSITAPGSSSGTSAANGQVVGQLGSSGGTNALIYPYALADTSATGNGIGFATYDNVGSPANGIRPLNFTSSTPEGSPDGVVNTFSTSSANVLLNTPVATTAASGVNSINSLTIDASTGGALAISSSSTVVLQSGGLLALNGTSTISGPGVLTTSGVTMYIHAPNPDGGGATQLNINVPIANLTAGVVKSDNGTAVFGVPQMYIGGTYINYGTLQLAGGSQTIFQPFQTPPGPGATASSNAATTTQVNYGGTLDLNGNSQTLQNLTASVATQLTGGTITNSSLQVATLSIAPNAAFTWPGNISGNLNFVRDGFSTTTINSPQTYTGTTTLLGGVTSLVDYGSLQTSGIDIRRSSLLWDNSGITAMSNRLTNGGGLIPITFDGGAFRFNARGGMSDSANIGAINVNSGSARIDVQANNGSATLNISSLTRSVGSDLTFCAGAGAAVNNGGLGDNPYILLGSAPALTNGMIGAWAVTLGQDIGQGGTAVNAAFATYDPTTGIRGLESYNQVGGANSNQSAAQGNLFLLNNNTHLVANATLPGTPGLTSTTTINSLTMTNAAITLTFVNPTDTLVLQSGGLLSGTDGNNRTVGAIPGQGYLTAAAGQQELFLHNGANTLTINSNIVDNGSPVNLVIDTMGLQGPAFTLAGSNTYSGTTYVNGGIVNLSSTAGLAIPSANVIIANNNNNGSDSGLVGDTTLTLQASNQINPAATVSVLGGGELVLNSNNQTIKNLVINNDGSTNGGNGPAVLTGTGMLTVTGSISAINTGITTAFYDIPTINGLLTLSNPIYVDPTAIPNQIGLQLNSAVTLAGTAGLTKTGLGVLGIGGQSGFTAGTTIAQGTLAFGSNSAFIGNSQVTIAAGATLNTYGFTGTIGSLTGSGTLTNNTSAGPGTLVTGWDNTNATFSGAMTNPFVQSPLNVTKIGSGNWNLSANNAGSGNSPNLGALTVSGGSVTLNSAAAQLGFSSYTLNAGGSLVLDNSVSPVNNRLGGSFLSPSAAVPSPTLRAVNFQGGNLTIKGNAGTQVTENLGAVNPGAGGVLTIAANNTAGVNLNVSSLLPSASNPVFPGELYDIDASNAASLTMNGANVTQINDLTGNGYNFANAASTVALVNGGAAFNNRNVLNFNGTTNAAVAAATATLTMGKTTSPLTVFIVEQAYTNSLGIANMWGFTGNDHDIRVNTGPVIPNNGGTANGNDYSDGTGGNIYVNGVLAPGNVTAGVPQIIEAYAGAGGSALPWTSTSLSNYSFDNRGYVGDIGEVIAFSSAISAAESQQIEAFLAAKWTTSGGTGSIPPGYGSNSTLLVRGDNLGNPPGPNTATLTLTASNYVGLVAQGSGTNGTTYMSISPSIIVDQSATGSGTGFAVIDTTSNLLRPLLSSSGELATSVSMLSGGTAGSIVNAGFTSPQIMVGNTYANSLTLSGSGSIASLGSIDPTADSLAALTINTGGILATSGTTSISAALTSATLPMIVHVAGAGTVLQLNGPIVNSSGGLVKSDAGTLVINAPQFFSGGLQINGGSVQLNAGNNTLPVVATATVPTVYAVAVNSGTLDLNGTSQAVGPLSSINTLPGTGGTITNLAHAPATLFVVSPGSTFGGTLSDNPSGPLSLDLSGVSPLTLTSPSSYTGSTTIRGGSLTLTNSGALTGSSAVNVNYADLTLDNTGLTALASRLGGAPLNMSGGSLAINGRMGNDTLSISALNVVQGGQSVTLNLFNGNQQTGAVTLNIGALTQANAAAINFTAPNVGTLGALGDTGHIFITSAPALINNIIGGWATVNGADFASYSGTQGVGAMGTAGFPGYSGDALTAGVPTDNVNMTASVVGVTTRTINSLRITAGTATLNDNNQVLAIATGGLLVNSAASVINGGQLTAGSAANTAGTLYQYQNAGGTLTVNSSIVNNGTAPVTLVHSGGGALALNPLSVVLSGTAASGSFTVPVTNNSGLFVGETVAGTGVAGTITSINGNVLGLSSTTTAAVAANTLLTFTPPAVAAVENGTTTLSVQTAQFTPIVGMTVGGPGIPVATTITAVSGGPGNWTVTLSNPATQAATPTLTFGANSNTYSGGTVVNGLAGATSQVYLNGQPGSIVIPGNLTIQGNGAVTEGVNAGQIAPASNVLINGSGVLNLTSTTTVGNVLTSVTFNNNGGTGTPTVNLGTTQLTLTSAAPITSNNDNLAATPTISGGSLNLSNLGGSTISTTGLSPIDLVISAPILSAVGGITKAGTGSVVFNSGASTFTSGVKLNSGTIILGASSPVGGGGPLGNGVLTTANNTTLLSGSAAQSISNPVTVNGNLNFGGSQPSNNVILGGTVTLNGAASLTVVNPLVTATLSAPISSLNGLTKAGNGTLVIGAANSYGGPTNITGGVLKVSSLPIFSAPAGELYDLDASNASSITLSGTNVQQINDLSGNNNNFGPAPGFTTSTVALVNGGAGFSGRNVLFFNGPNAGNNSFSNSLYLGTSTTPATVFIVEQVTGLNGSINGVWGKYNVDDSIRVEAGPVIVSNPGGANTNDYCDGTGGASYVNGVLQSANIPVGSPQVLQVNAGASQLGGATFAQTVLSNNPIAGQNRAFYGDIGEVIAFSSTLSAAQSQYVSNYLQTKWFGGSAGNGGALPATTPVTISNGGALDLTNVTQTIASLSSTDGHGSQVLLGSGALTINGAATTTFDGAISGAGGQVFFQGTGTTYLTGSSSFGGGTTITSGVVDVQNSMALGTGSVGVLNNAGAPSTALWLDSPTGITLANAFVTTGNGNGNGADPTGPGVIQNVRGNNALSGLITLTSAGGDTTIKSNAGSLTLSGTVTTDGAAPRTLYLGGTALGNISGVIADSGTATITVNKVDSGAWILSGNNNTYSGGTTVGNGILVLANSAGLSTNNSATGSGDVTMNGGTLSSIGAGSFMSGNVQIGSGPFTIGPGFNGSVGTLTVGTNVNLNSTSTLAFKIIGNTSDLLAINGSLNVTGMPTIQLSSSGLLTATDILMTFNASSGLGLVNPASDFNVVNLPANSNLEYLGNSLELVPNANIWAFPVSGNWGVNTNWTGAGTAVPPPNGVGASAVINQATSSPLTVTVNAPQTVGTLLLGNSSGVATGYTIAGPSALTFNNAGNGAVIGVTDGVHQISAPVILSDNLVISPSAGSTLTISGNISQSAPGFSLSLNGFAFQPNGLLVLSGSNGYSGGTTVSAGTLQIGNVHALGSGGLTANGGVVNLAGINPTIPGLSGAAGTITNTSGTATLTVNEASSTTFSGSFQDGTGKVALSVTGPSALVLNGSSSYSGGTTVAGTLQLGDGVVANGSVQGAIRDNGTLIFANPTLQTSSNIISGSGAVTMAGPGLLVLSASNGYTGLTTVLNGTLQVGNLHALGSGGLVTDGGIVDLGGFSPSVASLSGLAGSTITNNGAGLGTLTVNQASTMTFAGTLQDGTSPLGLLKSGAGKLVLTGFNNYSGGTTISAGTLQVGDGVSNAGFLLGSVLDNATLAFATPANQSQFFSSAVSGSGALNVFGAGTLVVFGSNTYSGGTTVAGGVLNVRNRFASATGSGPLTLNGGTLASGVTPAVVGGSVISGTGPNAINPDGIGPIGTLSIGGSLSLNSNATLDFDVAPTANDELVIAGSLAFSGGGKSTINISPSGTLTGAYILASFSGAPASILSDFTLNGAPNGYTLQLAANNTELELAPSGPPTWISPVSGSWSVGTNWSSGQGPNGAGQKAIFSGTANSAVTVTLDVPRTVGALVLGNSSGPSTSYNIGNSGNTLTLNNSGSQASVLVFGGTHTISAPVSLVGGNLDVVANNSSSLMISGNLSDDSLLRSLTLDGDGTALLTLTGSNSYGGGTYVHIGVLDVATVNSLPVGSNLYVGATASSFSPVVAGPSIASVPAAGPETVPEPGTLVLLLAGLAIGIGTLRKRHIN
jgi:autotransporter-associated beta strand protein